MTVTCDVTRLAGAGWRSLTFAVALTVSLPPAAVAERPIGGPADARKKVQAPPGPVLAVVSLAKQRMQIYGSSGLLAESPVSSGMAGHRTPPGVFTVLEKNRFHFSNIYSGAPMPYMQRLTWSGVALHGGVVPGYPASHGCVRLPHKFAPELWGMTTLGTRVVVAPHDPVAAPVEHARLPAPRLLPLPPGVAELSGKGAEVASAPGGTMTDAGAPSALSKLLNPVERAKAMRGFVVKDAADKAKSAKAAVETAAARADEARRAAAALRAAEHALILARRRHEIATKTAETAAARAADTAAAERAKAALTTVEADLAAAERRTEEASLIEAVALEASAAAAAVVVETEHARREAAAALKLSERADAPISILVSRKAGKVFIRQAWIPIHEAPVTFTDDGPALGTHVYLAMAPSAEGERMSWLSVSLPASAPEPPRQRGKAMAKPVPTPAPPSETATGALTRFELPASTRRFIEERLWTGATLIVSDVGTSPHETGLHTDFVVLTR
jgi:hypothetical protein